jgi:CheY-like chemotaxis protein
VPGTARGTLDGGGKIMANKKVLVVDDEIHIVHVVAIKLRNNGYEVISADNGAEGLKLALGEKPDIIVTDYQMPVMTGVELVQKLRQHEETKDTPVIMLTARSFAIPQEQQEDLRIAGCLSKPFSPKELLGNIEDVLYQKEMAPDN